LKGILRRYREGECTAFIDRSVHANTSSMHFNELFRDSQIQTDSLRFLQARWGQLIKLKYLVCRFLWNTRACIQDGNLQSSLCASAQLDRDVALIRREFDRITDQVGYHLRDFVPVGVGIRMSLT
jgi:hypothetical protein